MTPDQLMTLGNFGFAGVLLILLLGGKLHTTATVDAWRERSVKSEAREEKLADAVRGLTDAVREVRNG